MTATGIEKTAVTGGFQRISRNIDLGGKIIKTILHDKTKEIFSHSGFSTEIILQKMAAALFDVVGTKLIFSQFTQSGK